jgi:hypothetical protein
MMAAGGTHRGVANRKRGDRAMTLTLPRKHLDKIFRAKSA